MQTQLSEMGKVQLRAACRDAKITNYSKMSVATMRAALAALTETNEKQRDSTLLAEVFPVPALKERATDTPRVRAAEQNGIKRPIKGLCADVWAACDALLAQGTAPDAATMRELADNSGWNRNNVSIELSRWRKFNGVERPKKS